MPFRGEGMLIAEYFPTTKSELLKTLACAGERMPGRNVREKEREREKEPERESDGGIEQIADSGIRYSASSKGYS